MAKSNRLPQEAFQAVTPVRILLSVVYALLLVCFTNSLALWYLNYYPRNTGYLRVSQKWKLLLDLKQPVDWLILGDSSCGQGIDPSLLERTLKVKALNLCTTGDAGVINNAWMLSEYIKKYGAPRQVLLVHVYDVWHRDMLWSLVSQVPLPWGFWNQFQPSIQPGVQGSLNIFLDRYVPLYSKNLSLQDAIAKPDTLFQSRARFSQSNRPDFMFAPVADPADVIAQRSDHIDFAKDHKFKLSSVNRLALQHIIDLANRYQFPVVIVNSPIDAKLYQDQSFQIYYNQLQQFMQAFVAQSRWVHYIPEPVTFNENEMTNSDHIIYSAAQTYTKTIIKQVNALTQP
uniref:Uncharacterized protein n=1 Tax=Cyanothece sp. (strain PCC 7425 / ATCC 29141) TaxID=395961 RepID=B8HW28_CYAP4